MPEKFPDEIRQLGELMYYQEAGTEFPFENMTEDARRVWYMHASCAVVGIYKMNKVIVKKPDELSDPTADRNRRITALDQIIENFLKGLKTAEPSKFPVRELSLRIMAGRRDT